MKIAGNYNLDSSPERLWPLIFEPATLLQLLPGCDQIEQVAPNEYRGRMTLRVPALAGSYETHVKVLEYQEPSFCRIEGEAYGSNGSVRGGAAFTLVPLGAQTRVEYQGDAQISGPLGSMNPRFAEGVAQTLIRQGLARLPELAEARGAAAGAAEGAATQERAARGGSLGRRLRRFFGKVRERLVAFIHRLRGGP